MKNRDIIPYSCVYVDASLRDFITTARQCVYNCAHRDKVIEDIQTMWMNKHNQNSVLPVLSVRSGLDIYLSVMNFPPGSEIILSAINIPDVVQVVHHHKLKIVPLDISIKTLAPKHELLEDLITDKTVALLLAHIYGRWFDMEPFIRAAEKYKLAVIEDCAECFCGFDNVGHPKSDIALFSFGAIKYYTAFGGAIAKVKDPGVYLEMAKKHSMLPLQDSMVYLKKILRFSLAYLLLNVTCCNKIGRIILYNINFDYKEMVVKMLRGFPESLMQRIRFQPCTPLLVNMLRRMREFKTSEFAQIRAKAHYVCERLPSSIIQVGTEAHIKNHWLFPIIVENPKQFENAVNEMGVDAYRGATQLGVVEADDTATHQRAQPHEARFLHQHTVYLPINKHVPYKELDRMCQAIAIAMKSCDKNGFHNSHKFKIHFESKL